MKKISFLLLFSFPVLAGAQAKLKATDLQELQTRMTGSFSSEAQHRRDTANYFHIRLEMRPIWTELSDGYWLYVEQAEIRALDKPYRQRIYRLSLSGDTVLVSQVFELPNPLRFAGAWKNPALLQTLRPDSLLSREGCAIYLTRDANGDFHGSTPGDACKSSLRGASYATSEAHIYPDRLETWDRGWNAEGKQVWGAVQGGYVFQRRRGNGE